MNVNLNGSRRSRTSIAAVMLWIAGIALVLGMLRATEGPALLVLLGEAVVLVITPTLTFRGVKWLDRRLIESRPEASTPLGRAIEVGLLFAWSVFIVLLTCTFGLVVGVLGFMGIFWLVGQFR